MSTSLTWQELPEWLQEPVIRGHLSLAEAAELWDYSLTGTEAYNPLPPHLFPAAERLCLLEMEASPTQH